MNSDTQKMLDDTFIDSATSVYVPLIEPFDKAAAMVIRKLVEIAKRRGVSK